MLLDSRMKQQGADIDGAQWSTWELDLTYLHHSPDDVHQFQFITPQGMVFDGELQQTDPVGTLRMYVEVSGGPYINTVSHTADIPSGATKFILRLNDGYTGEYKLHLTLLNRGGEWYEGMTQMMGNGLVERFGPPQPIRDPVRDIEPLDHRYRNKTVDQLFREADAAFEEWDED